MPNGPPRTDSAHADRDLTSAEFRGLQALGRAARRERLVAAAFFLVLGAGGLWFGWGPDPERDVFRVLGWTLMGFGVFIGAVQLRPPAERPGGHTQRVGRLAGVVSVSGKPARVTVGGVPVVIPHAWAGRFPLGEYVELEVTPPLGAGGYLDRNRWRTIVSAYDRRLWAADADPLQGGTPGRAPRRAPAVPPAPSAAAVAAAFVGEPRPLTPEDLRYVDHFTAPDYGPLALAVPAVPGALWFTWEAARSAGEGRWGMVALAAGLSALLGAAAWFFGAAALRPPPLGRREEFARAQRVRGRLAVTGIPPRANIGPVAVASLPLDYLPEGATVEADVSPALADDPRPDRRRVLVGVPRVVAWPGARANEDLATSA